MDVTCPHCGNRYEIDEGERYRYVKCTVCGRGYVAGATTSHTDNAPVHAAVPDDGADVPDLPPEAPKSKLGIRRASAPDAPNIAAQRAVASVEARQTAAARAARKRKVKAALGNLLSLLVLAALAAGGYWAWTRYGAGALDAYRARTSGTSSEEAAEDGEPTGREQAPTGLAQDLADAAQTLRDQAEKAVAHVTGNRYDGMAVQFRGARLAFWQSLAKSKRPGATEGRFLALLPAASRKAPCYDITSSPTGIVSIVCIGADGREEPVSVADFTKRMDGGGGFVLAEARVYAVRPVALRKKRLSAPDRGSRFNPAKAYLDTLYEMVDAQRLDAHGVSYEVSFTFNEKEKLVPVAVARHGESVPYEAFAKAAEPFAQEIQRKQAGMDFKARKYKRTVVFYNGAFISKGIGGVTKIPRQWRSNDAKGRAEWHRLWSEATRQEAEAVRFAEEEKRRYAEWRRKVHGPPDPKLVEQVLAAGSVSVKPVVKETP